MILTISYILKFARNKVSEYHVINIVEWHGVHKSNPKFYSFNAV